MSKERRIMRERNRIMSRISPERSIVRISMSNKHFYSDVTDISGRTITSASSISENDIKPNMIGAEKIGNRMCEKIRSAGITHLVLDKCGKKYHGVVAKFADTLRKGGLEL